MIRTKDILPTEWNQTSDGTVIAADTYARSNAASPQFRVYSKCSSDVKRERKPNWDNGLSRKKYIDVNYVFGPKSLITGCQNTRFNLLMIYKAR